MRTRNIYKATLAGLMLALAAAAPALAQVNNITQATSHATIQAAINAAVNGDIIEADPGTYFENINYSGKNIVLRSASGDPSDTIIDGGGVSNCVRCLSGETAAAVLQGFTLTNGSFVGGGGLYAFGSKPTVRQCVFTANHSTGAGGAVYLPSAGADSTFIDCSFIGNSASSHAGAVYCPSSNPTFINCLFSGNSATGVGSAIYAPSSGISLTNCTFAGNAGGASNVIYITGGGSPASVMNCVFWGNSNGILDGSGTTTYGHNNLQFGVPGGINAGGNISIDPLFADADGPDNTPGTIDDDLRLSPLSPCNDAGDNAAPQLAGITTDLDGNSRFYDDPYITDTGVGPAPVIDMGPYELQCVAPDPLGACCLAGGICMVGTEAACTDALGTYQGDSTNCAGSPCGATCAGDLDGDGDCDVFDFAIFGPSFGCGTK